MGIEDKLVEGWVDDEQQTFGQRFVERFPSQIKDDPELKMKQERNVQWLIDTLVPQSGSDVAITAGSILAGGPVGRLFGRAAKPVLSKYYASILGSGKIKKVELKKYLDRMIFGKHSDQYTANWGAIDELKKQSPSLKKLKLQPSVDKRKAYVVHDTEMKGGEWVQKNPNAFDDAAEGLIKEAKDAYKYYYEK